MSEIQREAAAAVAGLFVGQVLFTAIAFTWLQPWALVVVLPPLPLLWQAHMSVLEHAYNEAP